MKILKLEEKKREQVPSLYRGVALFLTTIIELSTNVERSLDHENLIVLTFYVIYMGQQKDNKKPALFYGMKGYN